MSSESVCPHCGQDMKPIRTPMESSWGGEVHHICFNDDCCYFVQSWEALGRQGIEGTGYRCRMDPRGSCGPAPVWSADALKNLAVPENESGKTTLDYFSADDMARDDQTPDEQFYRTLHVENHLDSLALSTMEQLYGRLIPKGSRVLDLMAGPNSHLGRVRYLESITGLGLNGEDLASNLALSRRVIHDLNADPKLPFGKNDFDVVINTVSVDYMTQPLEVFREVARVLKPGGLFVVVFSNRMFPPKAVNLWKLTDEKQRVDLVRKYFQISDRYVIEGHMESVGKPRPKDDKYYQLGIPSDPVYAVWATVLQ